MRMPVSSFLSNSGSAQRSGRYPVERSSQGASGSRFVDAATGREIDPRARETGKGKTSAVSHAYQPGVVGVGSVIYLLSLLPHESSAHGFRMNALVFPGVSILCLLCCLRSRTLPHMSLTRDVG